MTNLQNTLFLHCLALEGVPVPVREHSFHPTRKWRFDYAFPLHKLAVEIEGGALLTTKTGRSKGHAHPKRFFGDMEKYNAAAVLHWRVLRFTPNQCCTKAALATIKQALAL